MRGKRTGWMMMLVTAGIVGAEAEVHFFADFEGSTIGPASDSVLNAGTRTGRWQSSDWDTGDSKVIANIPRTNNAFEMAPGGADHAVTAVLDTPASFADATVEVGFDFAVVTPNDERQRVLELKGYDSRKNLIFGLRVPLANGPNDGRWLRFNWLSEKDESSGVTAQNSLASAQAGRWGNHSSVKLLLSSEAVRLYIDNILIHNNLSYVSKGNLDLASLEISSRRQGVQLDHVRVSTVLEE